MVKRIAARLIITGAALALPLFIAGPAHAESLGGRCSANPHYLNCQVLIADLYVDYPDSESESR